jgi:hypothetical protein
VSLENPGGTFFDIDMGNLISFIPALLNNLDIVGGFPLIFRPFSSSPLSFFISQVEHLPTIRSRVLDTVGIAREGTEFLVTFYPVSFLFIWIVGLIDFQHWLNTKLFEIKYGLRAR